MKICNITYRIIPVSKIHGTKAWCQSIFIHLFFFIFYFNYIFFVASRFTQEFYRAHFTIIRANFNIKKLSITGVVTLYVQISVDARLESGGISSFLLVAFLFTTLKWLMFPHWKTCRERALRFYARKTGPRLLDEVYERYNARVCKICMKFVARTRRTFYGIIATTSLECQFEYDAHVNELHGRIVATNCVARANEKSQDRNPNHNIRKIHIPQMWFTTPHHFATTMASDLTFRQCYEHINENIDLSLLWQDFKLIILCNNL